MFCELLAIFVKPSALLFGTFWGICLAFFLRSFWQIQVLLFWSCFFELFSAPLTGPSLGFIQLFLLGLLKVVSKSKGRVCFREMV